MTTRLICGAPHAIATAAPELDVPLRHWQGQSVENAAQQLVCVEDAGGRVTVRAIARTAEAYALRKALLDQGRDVDDVRVV